MQEETDKEFIQISAINFLAVDHCNLKCEGCNQASPFLKKKYCDLSLFRESLSVLSKYLRIGEIRLLGGEPLLHPEIDSIISIARESKMFESILVVTNGRNLLKMTPKFWQGIDRLYISKYPANASFINKTAVGINYVCRANNVQLGIGEFNYFHRVLLTKPITDTNIINETYRKCHFKELCRTLKDGKLYRCTVSATMNDYQAILQGNSFIKLSDELEIRDSLNFKADLSNYLTSNTPLGSCKFCLGSQGESFPHRQLTKEEISDPAHYAYSEEKRLSEGWITF